MTEMTSPEARTPGRHRDDATTPGDKVDDTVNRRLQRRAALRDRHAQGLTRLLAERSDLRGVNALADLVDDSVRWTA